MTLKRSPLKRRTLLVAKTAPKRSTRINPVNRERSVEKRGRNFGDEAERVGAMECACTKRLRDDWMLGNADKSMACAGKVEAAHVVARGGGGAKGDRWRLVPLCTRHHREAGEAPRPGTVGDAGTQRQVFERRYGLDLIDEADRIALEHPRPLGIRGLADRFAGHHAFEQGWTDQTFEPEPLDDHELDALLGWVHREMGREVDRREDATCRTCDGEGVEPTRLQQHEETCPDFRTSIDDDVVTCIECGAVFESCRGCADYAPGRERANDTLAHHIARLLGGVFLDDSQSVHVRALASGERSLARTLCEAAAERFGGWPS